MSLDITYTAYTSPNALFGTTHDVAELVRHARRELVQRLHVETQRQLGRGAELERILFVGGGAVALAEDIRDWFPNQTIAPHPAFANARGIFYFYFYRLLFKPM